MSVTMHHCAYSSSRYVTDTSRIRRVARCSDEHNEVPAGGHIPDGVLPGGIGAVLVLLLLLIVAGAATAAGRILFIGLELLNLFFT